MNTKETSMVSADEGRPRDDDPASESTTPMVPARRADAEGGSLFELYKPGQGAHVRWGTAVGAFVLCLGFVGFLADQLAWFSETIRYSIPVVVLVGLTALIFRFVGQTRGVVEFLIATEGEMKKVNWSTRREVIGSTKVVIVTVLAIAFIMFAVNLLLMLTFESIGVLKLGMVKQMFAPN